MNIRIECVIFNYYNKNIRGRKDMKNIAKKSLAAVVLAATFVATATPVKACTGVIVGKDITEDGNYIFGRTEDLEVVHNKAYKLHEAGEHKEGDTLKDVSYDEELGYEFVLTHDSYRFTSISDTTPEYGEFDEAGFNEKGLICDMTVSASPNDKVLEIDPFVEDETFGISEAIMPTVVLSEADNALNAIKLLADEVAVKGAVEGNGLVVADKDEVWYMEIYTGHQFVAMKYPADKFSVFPNTFWLNECKLDTGKELEHYNISKNGEFIFSKDIFKVAEDAGTFKGNKEESIIDLVGSYNPEEYRLSNISRAWSGIKHFNPNADVDQNTEVFEFLQDADHKITLDEVFQFTRNRMENVGVTANDLSRDADPVYPIGNRNTMESHVFETYAKNPVEFPGVMYLAIGSPLVSPYVPYFPNQEDFIPEAGNLSNDPVEDSVYWTALDTLFMVEANREPMMKMVNAELEKVQKDMIVSPVAISSEEATELNKEKATEALAAQKNIQAELKGAYEKFLETNKYDTIFNARRRTADFAGTVLMVEPDTYNKHLGVRISLEPTTFYICDDYGTPVEEKLNKEVKINVPVAALGENAEVEEQEGFDVKLEKNGDLYTITTNAPTVTMKEEVAPADAEVEEPAPVQTTETKTNDGAIWAVVALIAIIAVFVAKSKKKDN